MTRQIREQINSLIDAGTLVAGTLLPSERDLANTLKVARNVVRGAYEQLMEAGRLTSEGRRGRSVRDRKSTRLNSSHDQISYAVFCLKKKNKNTITD